MVNDILTQFKFKAFITSLFSLNVKLVFFSKDSLYLSFNSSIRLLSIVSLIISVILYKLYDQLVVSSFEKVVPKLLF